MVIPASMAVDFLAARMHGRRSRMMDAALDRAGAVAQAGSVAALVQALHGPAEATTTTAVQQWLERQWAGELRTLGHELGGVSGAFLEWLAVRPELEDFKRRLRAGLAPPAPGEAGTGLDTAGGVDDSETLPIPELRGGFAAALQAGRGRPWPGYMEVSLDRAYLVELLARGRRLPPEPRVVAWPLVEQEVGLFHLRLVLWARASPGFDSGWLAAQHLAAGALPRREFERMLRDAGSDPLDFHGVQQVLGLNRESVTPALAEACRRDPARLERLAWDRYARLATRALRRSHVGVGALIGYAGLRRIEVANLATVSEGIRLGVEPGALVARLLRATREEAGRV